MTATAGAQGSLDSPDAPGAFDALAPSYDDTFTDTVLGARYRAAVWRRFAHVFPAGAHVLELGCGTGVDAVELARRGCTVLATDASAAMVAATAARASAAGCTGAVTARRMRIEDLRSLAGGEHTRFDGVLSDFGALNCVASLDDVARDLAPLVRPGGRVLLCVMGPLVPWELAWFGVRGAFGKAVRRLRATEDWRGVTVRYPSVAVAARAFAPWFATTRRSGLGVLLPPPYAEPLAGRAPRAVAALDALERRIEALPGVARLGDHYVLELERRWG